MARTSLNEIHVNPKYMKTGKLILPYAFVSEQTLIKFQQFRKNYSKETVTIKYKNG